MVAMTESATAPENADGADDAWHTPSPRLLRLRQIEVAVVTLPLAFLVALSFRIKHGVAAGAASLVVVLALGALLAWFIRRRFGAWRYQERYEDLVVTGRGLDSAGVGRPLRPNAIRRAHGRTVRAHVLAFDGQAAHRRRGQSARIPGLAHQEAARLRDRLTELGEAKAAGL